MFISTAYAQGTGIFDQNALIQFLPLILIFVVFYFLLIRPQQRKAKDHKTMLDALRRGDRVVTGGGIIGTVARVDSPEEVIVDIADGVRVRVLRSTITSVLAKPDPAAAREAAKQRTEARAKVGPNNGLRDEPVANPRPPSPGGLDPSPPALRERVLSAAKRVTGSLARAREK
ncbi:MAG: preprotein translocase subunit YajC [Stellaceae bacterium]